ATPEFAARRLVANAAIEARAQNVQLGFAHGALQPQQQPVIEHRRVIEAVAIADQRVDEAGEIDEAIPFGIVAGQARDFQTQHEADTGERHLGSEPGKAGAGPVPPPDRPKSSSMMTIRSAGQPSSRALLASAYCRSVDSRLCSTCAALD